MKYGEVSIAKRKSGGSWTWAARMREYQDDGTSRQLLKVLGIPCDPPTDDERGRGKRTAPTGRGARQALKAARSWREGLAAAHEEDTTNAHPLAGLSVHDLVVRYWSTRSISPVTRDGYRKLERHIEPLTVTVDKLTPADVQGWVTGRLADGVSENTMNKTLNQVKYALRWAVAMGWLQSNPADAVRPPKRSKRGANPLDADGAARLHELLSNLREGGTPTQLLLADAATLALHTGMRIGELCGLRVGDVDGMTRGEVSVGALIHVRRTVIAPHGGKQLSDGTKNGERRDVPASRTVTVLLNRIRRDLLDEVGRADVGDCFVLSRPGARFDFLSTSYLSNVWRAFAAANSIKGVTGERCHFHDLRHTWATLALSEGVAIPNVARVLGHVDSATTLRYYARWLPSDTAQAVRDVSRKVAEDDEREDVSEWSVF